MQQQETEETLRKYFFPVSTQLVTKLNSITFDNIDSTIALTSSAILCIYPNPLDFIDKLTVAITSSVFYHGRVIDGKKSSQFIKEWQKFVGKINNFKMHHPSSSVFYALSRFYEETSNKQEQYDSLQLDFFLAALHCNIYFFENHLHPQSTHVPVLLYKLVMLARAYASSLFEETQMNNILEHAFKMFRYVYEKHNASLSFVNAFDETVSTIQFPFGRVYRLLSSYCGNKARFFGACERNTCQCN